MTNRRDRKQKQKILGAAAGVAAAATAVGVAAILHRRRPTTYHVRPGEDGWTLEAEGSKRAESTHRTKRAAVKAGRKLATENAPAHLVIHRSDDSVQQQHGYGIEG